MALFAVLVILGFVGGLLYMARVVTDGVRRVLAAVSIGRGVTRGLPDPEPEPEHDPRPDSRRARRIAGA